ncbi:hypothetical protein BH09PSE1_BH09PSE1_31200 [soil metagenome]
MATYTQLPSGAWRVQVRKKGRYISETFAERDAANLWATEVEAQITRGESPRSSTVSKARTFGRLIDIHIADMKEVGKAPGRTKIATLEMLSRRLGCGSAWKRDPVSGVIGVE